MNQYEQMFKKVTALVPHLAQIEPGEGLKLKADGFMDLHIDVLWKDKDRTTISMAHYYKLNGDMVPDPDMEIALYPDRKMAEALSYQDSFGYRQVYPEPNKVDVRAKTDLNQFLNQWLNNIRMQGHKLEDQQGKGQSL